MEDRSNAAYVRVSSDKQDTARQEKRISATGFPITFWFKDDTGKNPRDLAHKRPAFQDMLKAVQAGLIGRIIVDRQDRFGVKDAYQWGEFISLLREHGTTLEDADGKVLSADDDVSILTGTLGAITSTREQKEKAHRSITGKVSKAKNGEYQGGYPPYGFDVVCFGANGKEKWRTVYVGPYKRVRVWPDGQRERFDGKDNSPRKDPTDKLFIRPSIEKDRIKVVKQLFEWYATEDISPRQIATRLADLKVDAVYGNGWDKVRIHGMLGNPAYRGFPTWNKQGSSRFVEYVDGRFQEVQDKVTGRNRREADYVQPAKPLYKPLVPQKTWDKVQAKLKQGTSECPPRRPASTAELYLKPFMVCAHCGKVMHGTMGRGTDRLWPSYFCATYGKFGPKNPTGCHCHRVRHSVMEKIVKAYLAETAPKIAQLLDATDNGDLAAAKPLLDALVESKDAFRNTACEIEAFIANTSIQDGEEDEEIVRMRRQKRGLDEIYGVLYERFRPTIEASIAEQEAVLDKLLDEYVGLPPKVKERMNKRMEALQDDIDRLREQLIDLREPWGNLRGQLVERKKTLDHAVKTLRKDKSGREKTEALKGVISEIRCTFRHTATKEAKHNGKSYLETVEIVPVSGESCCFTNGSMPGPGSSPRETADAHTPSWQWHVPHGGYFP